MKEVYAIMNMDKYASYMREKAALSFTNEYEENLDDFVSIKQVRCMIEDYSSGTDEKGRVLLDEDGRSMLLEALTTRLYNMGLAKLAARGILECAWDDGANQMVFWSRQTGLP
jgi:hypothetical protein